MRNFLAIALLCAVIGFQPGQAQCPEEFIEFFPDPAVPMGTCIHFGMDRKRDWHAAKDYCVAKSSVLAKLDPGQLHYQVIDYILGNEAWKDEAFHIGCTDELHEGQWLWIMDDTSVSMGLPHWLPGQPDGGTAENYCCLYYVDFMYNSCKNGQTMYTICMI
ncbi:hepatic lectin-like [Macrobrachium rosenbergii]|uniref:hepatic lectin-like n=1 Tax=Macrobrachium rosenbergii TaxID=79674 RepID=UPI0034D4EF5F